VIRRAKVEELLKISLTVPALNAPTLKATFKTTFKIKWIANIKKANFRFGRIIFFIIKRRKESVQ
jgi:hypothetical protein